MAKLKPGSIEIRLIMFMLFLAILPITAVSWVAYNIMFEHIRSERIETVSRVADSKRAQLAMVLTRANDRAKSFLSNLITECGGNATKQSHSCAANLIKSYLAAENASGATLRRQGAGESLTIGTSAVRNEEHITFQAGQIAQFSGIGPGNNRSYFISVAEPAGFQLVITYPSLMLDLVFALSPAELGNSGEAFLADGGGYFVTKPKYSSTQGVSHPISARPMQTCLSRQAHEVIDLDYRNIKTIMGFRFIPEFGSACIMAHIGKDEAFAPLKSLEQRLIISVFVFSVILVMIIVYVAKNIVRPISHLTKVANAIAAGDYTVQAGVEGNDEISELATSFNFMTSQLREQSVHLEERVKERTIELERAQREAEVLLRRNQALMLTSMDGIHVMDMQGNILAANDAFCRMLGYSREEVSGLNVAKWDAQWSVEELRARFRELVGKSAMFETLHRRKDGTLINVEISASGVEMEGQSFIFASSRDITGRKKAEDELRVAAAAFETHEAIMITDASANIIRVNQAFQDITGYSYAEVLGKNPRIMNSGRQERAFYANMWQQLTHTGAWSGEIWDKRKNGQIYPKWMTVTAVKNEQQETIQYVAIFSDITARKQAEEEIRNLAFYDALTKLPNRRLFVDRFRAALPVSARHNNYGAVLFIDLDKFKALNDALGHDYGDLLLIEVAARIKSCVREMDTVARLGGDEFVVLVEEISDDREEASRKVGLVAEKIREALVRPYLLKEHEHHSSPSIGISLYRGNEETVDTLLQHADMAMYQAKSSGGNAVRFFDTVMQHNVAAHAELVSDLRGAIEQRQLHLYYQVQVDENNRPLGAEALLRWIHPQRGMVMPEQFIPIAEESTLIFEIDDWVLETACRQLVLWGGNAQTRDLLLTVNISAKQFARPDFVDKVASILRAHEVNSARLKLELTEGMVLDDLAGAVKKMHALKALGVSLSMDNFGTRYSSLSYLKQLPLDQLKIDKDFVQAITKGSDDALLVQNIIDLVNNFNLSVIAEGVETEAQLASLKQRECITYQGFLFGKAVPIEEFEALLVKS